MKDIKVVCNYDKMVCSLYFDEILIKEFNLNKGDIGNMWGYFMYQPEGAPKQIKYHVILELSGKHGIPLDFPKLYIYPLYGEFALGQEGGYEVEVEGEYDTYLENHKHFKSEEND